MTDISANNKSIIDANSAFTNMAQIMDTVQKSADSSSKSLKEIPGAIGCATKLKSLFVAIEERKESYFVREAALVTAIDACVTAEEVSDIAWE